MKILLCEVENNEKYRKFEIPGYFPYGEETFKAFNLWDHAGWTFLNFNDSCYGAIKGDNCLFPISEIGEVKQYDDKSFYAEIDYVVWGTVDGNEYSVCGWYEKAEINERENEFRASMFAAFNANMRISAYSGDCYLMPYDYRPMTLDLNKIKGLKKIEGFENCFLLFDNYYTDKFFQFFEENRKKRINILPQNFLTLEEYEPATEQDFQLAGQFWKEQNYFAFYPLGQKVLHTTINTEDLRKVCISLRMMRQYNRAIEWYELLINSFEPRLNDYYDYASLLHCTYQDEKFIAVANKMRTFPQWEKAPINITNKIYIMYVISYQSINQYDNAKKFLNMIYEE